MRQPETDDIRLTMPYDTRAVRYSSTVTFTASPGL
jgi:hypothetical protein